MLESVLGGLPWGTITPSGLAVLMGGTFVWSVLSGKLIPHRWVEQRDDDHDAHVRYLEAALAEQRGTISSLTQQNAELASSGRLSVALLQTLQAPRTNSSIDAGSANVPAIEE
jgi:hypothetical protein